MTGRSNDASWSSTASSGQTATNSRTSSVVAVGLGPLGCGVGRNRSHSATACQQPPAQQVERGDRGELADPPAITRQPQLDRIDLVVDRHPDEHGAHRLTVLLGGPRYAGYRQPDI